MNQDNTESRDRTNFKNSLPSSPVMAHRHGYNDCTGEFRNQPAS